MSTADLAKCIGVTERTLQIYNTVSKETRRNVADAMVGNVEPAKVHSATDCKFEPKAYSLLPDEPTSSNAAAAVVPNTIPNMFMHIPSNPVVPNANPNMILPDLSNPVVPHRMPNMVLPQVPTVNPNATPVAQPLYPLHHPFPLGMGVL